ncbi:MAG: DUF4430 domain-containing protein [bacterium]|nr:DUF4430 domain-containing protein [bacterium]
MKEISWRVKKGWVYLLGICLILGVVAIGLQDSSMKAEGAQDPSVSSESTVTDSTEAKNEPVSTNTVPKKSENQPQNKPSGTKAKPVTTVREIQAGGVATAQVQTVSAVAPTVVTPVQKDTVEMNISGLGTYKVEIAKGENAFQALQAAANQNGFIVEYKMYSWGNMITKIGASKAQGTYYWALYYNGGYSMVGASDLILKNNDKVEWRYESWM